MIFSLEIEYLYYPTVFIVDPIRHLKDCSYKIYIGIFLIAYYMEL